MLKNNEYNTYLKFDNERFLIPTTTYFFRENLVEALCFLDSLEKTPKKYIIVPSSNGKEAYSLAVWLKNKTSKFEIEAYDINEVILEQAKKALYELDPIDKLNFSLFKEKCKISNKFFKKIMKTDYNKIQNIHYLEIPKELKKHVYFQYGDIIKNYFPGEIILSFNLLYHFEDKRIYKKALENLLKSAKKYLIIDKNSLLKDYLKNTELETCLNKEECVFSFENKVFNLKKIKNNLYFQVTKF